ncbi:transporter substrate-binding domain-containing protein [Vreelandella azerica]|uniref:transporter substrate-binding domain-containing protein n=1 Tax=Vreelandella azerica TaxID=2732867 RepID=UPI00149303D5|nr:transporter substrate-binding domain-containing protein [Halomonas azerica]
MPVALSLLLLTPAESQSLSLKVGVYDNPPKLFAGAEGELRGILGELLVEMANAEGWQLESVNCQWQECLDGLASGEIDILPDVAWSASRAGWMEFHQEPALHSWSQIYQREGLGLDAILDLDGRRLAVVNGSIQQRYLAELSGRFAIEIDWLGVESFADGFDAVKEGRADAAVANHLFGGWRAAEMGLQETAIIFQPVRLYYAVSVQAPQGVLARIDEYLKEWKAQAGSVYYTTLREWRAEPGVPRTPAWLPWTLAALLMMLLAALAGYWLQRQRSAHSAARLEAQREMLETILDSLEAHVYIKSPTLEYRYVNNKLCNFLKRSSSEILGHRDSEFLTRQRWLSGPTLTVV